MQWGTDSWWNVSATTSSGGGQTWAPSALLSSIQRRGLAGNPDHARKLAVAHQLCDSGQHSEGPAGLSLGRREPRLTCSSAIPPGFPPEAPGGDGSVGEAPA